MMIRILENKASYALYLKKNPHRRNSEDGMANLIRSILNV